jgi:hypothetical protein
VEPPTVYSIEAAGAVWHVRHSGMSLGAHASKADAVAAGRAVARAHPPSQLLVHRADTSIEFAYTYEDEPRSGDG